MADELLPRAKGTQGNPVTVKYVRREFRMFQVGEHELDTLASWDTSLYGTFLGISVGALIAVAITLFTVEINDPLRHASFVAVMWVSLASSVFLLLKVIQSARNVRAKIRGIKEETTR